MGKLIKHEFKGNFKKYSIVFITMSLLNILILSLYKPQKTALSVILMLLVDFAALLTVLIFTSNAFDKDLYEEKAYLIFTLPVKGWQMLGSKIITSIVYLAIVAMITGIFSYITINIFQVKIEPPVSFFIIAAIKYMYIVMLLILIGYFCTTLSRTTNLKIKIEKFMCFIIGVIVIALVLFINSKLQQWFPKEIIIGYPKFAICPNLYISTKVTSVCQTSVNFNIASSIYSIVLFVIFFISTSWMLDNKLDVK
ncbi:hypothetical protein [Haloimpatiens myeolchijeotgali]|uniref:hypothetical protein n=1 Tax=Haloimpatiens sp. FM7330 TaxID=3298610 RepID=UPI00384C1B91